MLCLLAQPVLCFFDPLWSTRHIDFQVYTIKLQPGFCVSCVLQCFSYFWTNFFYDVLSNFAIVISGRTTLIVKSAHRLWDLLSTFHICKKSICELDKASPKLLSRFVELCSLSGAANVGIVELWWVYASPSRHLGWRPQNQVLGACHQSATFLLHCY